MILDAQHLFSDAQALTATAASTNLIDLGTDGNVGVGEAMAVVIVLDVAADDSDADETYVAAIQTDTVAAFSSATELGSLTITRGDAAGSRYVFMLPKSAAAEQFLRINYTLGGTTPTATVTSFLIPADGVDFEHSYPNGYTIS